MFGCNNRSGCDWRIPVIHCLNVLDAVMTIFSVRSGAKELNPIMDYFLNIGEGSFLFVKVFAVFLSLLYLDKKLVGNRRKIFSYLLSVYVFVVLWHVVNIALSCAG